MERRSAQTLGSLLEEFFENNAQVKEKLMESRVLNGWTRVLGNGVASATRNLYLRNGILHVQLSSAIIRNELLLSKQRIISLLNEEAKGNIIRDIVFR